tara:strand:- start:737 stop:868 length:132 start_codon:yes stop_codon:yes gene_type:complete
MELLIFIGIVLFGFLGILLFAVSYESILEDAVEEEVARWSKEK